MVRWVTGIAILIVFLGLPKLSYAMCEENLDDTYLVASQELESLSRIVQRLDVSDDIPTPLMERIRELLMIADLSFETNRDYVSETQNIEGDGIYFEIEIKTAEIEISGVRLKLYRESRVDQEFQGHLEFTQDIPNSRGHLYFLSLLTRIFGTERIDHLLTEGKITKGIFAVTRDPKDTFSKIFEEDACSMQLIRTVVPFRRGTFISI